MTNDARLGAETQRVIEEAEIVVSTASLWEMVLKNAKGKLPLPPDSITAALESQGFLLLPIQPRHVEALRGLEFDHADPFDRMLIAQSFYESLPLLTRDSAILALGLSHVQAA